MANTIKIPLRESDVVEFKTVSAKNLPKNIWEPISAFSNADGGSIYLGINPQGQVKGVDSNLVDKFSQEILAICQGSFNHKIHPEIQYLENHVIQIYIAPAPSTMRPIFSNSRGLPKGARVRSGTSNVQINDAWLRRFAVAANGGSELIEFKQKYLDYFSSEQISTYLKAVKEKRGDVYQKMNQGEVLIKLRAITKDQHLTLFGLLAFSNNFGLQELTAPTLNIAVTQYKGTSKVNPTDIAEVSLDDREFSGNVAQQFENSLKFIMSKLPMRSRVESGGKRAEYLAIPKLAIRETLANSLVHRDYSTYGSRVQVDIYSDRVEFTNPGRSLIPLDQLYEAHPQARNPLLMSHLRDLNITEHRGRGIRTIIASLKEVGLAEPTFEHRHDWFVATLFSSAFIQDSDQDWLKKFQKYSLNERQLKSLVHIKHSNTGISNGEYRDLNNMTAVGDDRRANSELVRMVSLDILQKIGANRNRRYIFCN
jgi:ATP-dependent DNA helicase RecG